MSKAPSRPRDPNQLAKRIVDIATGDDTDESPTEKPQAAGGRVGGPKGGKARAEALSPEQRTQAARHAAAKRWESK